MTSLRKLRLAPVLALDCCLTVLLLTTLLGCNGSGSATSPTVQSIALSPAKQSIAAGASQQFTATATYTDGTTKDVTSTAQWASSNTAIATVSSSGLVTAAAAGQVTITAAMSGHTGSAIASVNPALKSLVISPGTYTGAPGGTVQLSATGNYSDGSTSDLTSSVTWSSSAASVATVNSAGLVTFVAAGNDTITASLNSISGTASLSVPELGVKDVSNTNPFPLTPISVTTQGLNVAAPITIQFSDSTGFSATESPIRVAPDGTIVTAVPLYLSASAGTLSSGSVSMTITQGSSTTSAITINIQALPTVASYGVQPGDITHAMLVLQALQLSGSLNALQAIQGAPGNQVDTTAVQASLKTQLVAAIEARSDVDRVAVNSSVVIPSATLTDGTTLQFDAPTLDLMDRLQAIFLTQTFGQVVLQAQASAATVRNGANPIEARRIAGRHSQPSGVRGFAIPGVRSVAAPSVNGLVPAPNRPTYNQFASSIQPRSALGNPQSQLGQILLAIEGLNTSLQLPLQTVKALDPKTVSAATNNDPNAILDQVSAIGAGIDAVNKLLPDAEKFGAMTAMLSVTNTVVHCLTNDAMYIYAGVTGDTATQAVIVQDMAENETKSVDALFALLPFVPGLGALQPAAEVASSVWGYWTTGRDYYCLANNNGSSVCPDKADTNTAEQADQQNQQLFSSTNPEFADVTGTATESSNLGVQAPQAGVELNPAPGGEIDTLADPNGDFQMWVPLGDPTFNYGAADFSLFDPVTDTVLSSETVDLSQAGSTASVVIPALSGTCNDTDIDNPDGDDPDCD
jgi:hypothetical protein